MNDKPLLLNRLDSAALLGISRSSFSSWVAAGILPRPMTGTKYWSRVQLERAAAGQTWIPPDEAAAAQVEDPWDAWEREDNARQAAEKK